MHLKGFMRTGGVVLNTDRTEYEIIKRERARGKQTRALESEVGSLREKVEMMMRAFEKLESK